MLKAFCEYLVSSGGPEGLVIGQTLFAGTRPQSAPHLCTVVMERTGMRVHPELKDQRELHFQVLTRAASYFAARDEAEKIFEWIVNQKGLDWSDWWICNVEGIAPAYIGMDDKSRCEFSSNLVVRARKKES